MSRAMTPANSVERDRPRAALVGSLRGFAATAAPHVKRWASSMSIRAPTWLGLVLALWSGMAAASEGLKYAGAYMCDPKPVVVAVVEACSRIDSIKSDRFKSAFQFWTSQNQSEIARLKDQCAGEVRKHVSTEADFLAATEALARVNNETITRLSAVTDGEPYTSYCAKYLNWLESGTKDVWRLFP